MTASFYDLNDNICSRFRQAIRTTDTDIYMRTVNANYSFPVDLGDLTLIEPGSGRKVLIDVLLLGEPDPARGDF